MCPFGLSGCRVKPRRGKEKSEILGGPAEGGPAEGGPAEGGSGGGGPAERP